MQRQLITVKLYPGFGKPGTNGRRVAADIREYNPFILRQAQNERVGLGCRFKQNRYGRIVYERRFCATQCVSFDPSTVSGRTEKELCRISK
jgi:hypothetical protein